VTKPYVTDLKHAAKENRSFRTVLYTAANSQLVLMTLQPGEEIGSEVHEVDQLLYAVDGEGEAMIGGSSHPFEKGIVVCVPAGTEHNVINTGDKPLRLFTVYAPPQHPAGTVHETKADALAAEMEPIMA
jgi:mannose-6-phosphate isomerase-like protein (cupin superfamily)